MTWELIENLDDYEFDKKLYGEMPEKVSNTEMNAILIAIKKSDQLAIRQAARISRSIKIFNRNSTILSILMIGIILIHLAVIIWR